MGLYFTELIVAHHSTPAKPATLDLHNAAGGGAEAVITYPEWESGRLANLNRRNTNFSRPSPSVHPSEQEIQARGWLRVRCIPERPVTASVCLMQVVADLCRTVDREHQIIGLWVLVQKHQGIGQTWALRASCLRLSVERSLRVLQENDLFCASGKRFKPKRSTASKRVEYPSPSISDCSQLNTVS